MNNNQHELAIHMCMTGMVYVPDDGCPCPEPTEELKITENGTYDVVDFGSVDVNVQLPEAKGVGF